MSGAPARKHFSVDEYYRMAQAGILPWNGRDELIEGEIIEMPPIGASHAACVARLNRLLAQLSNRAIVNLQNPLHLNDLSEPQPDVLVLENRADFYEGSHPGPKDVLLLIEVADTSLPFDRDVKVPAYARNGISEVWIVDLPQSVVEVHRQPGQQGYGEVKRYARGQSICPLAFPDVELPVNKILKPA